uniref:Uncharacterized protein n=1 Tax=Spumella elongata TaxID=89044 RepID=A0A7S3HJK1_9STRA
MTFARRGPSGDRAQPLMSSCWPVMLVLFTFVSPSTNWELAGMLTYPFFRSARDRCVYIAGAFVVTFCLDRLSRTVYCRPLPDVLANTSLFLYLFHPVIITVLLQVGCRDVVSVWIGSFLISVLLMCMQVHLCSRTPREAEGAALRAAVTAKPKALGQQISSSASDSESESDVEEGDGPAQPDGGLKRAAAVAE